MTRSSGPSLLDRLFAWRMEHGASDEEQGPSLAPPPLPLAKRLNRNALTVAAVLMGITVITSLVVFNTGNRTAAGNATSSAPAGYPPAQPTFLDRPVRGLSSNAADARQQPLGGDASLRPNDVGMQGAVRVARPYGASGALAAQQAPGTAEPDVPGGPRTTDAIANRQREQAFVAALRRSAVASSSDGGPGAGDALNRPQAGGGSPTASAEDRLLAYSDSVMRSAVHAVSSDGGGTASGLPTLSGARRAFLRESGDLSGRSTIARLEPAGSPFTLRAGTVIPGVLLTAITSTLPGDCMGQVARDVFDSKTQRILLIPKGTKLICRYDDQVVAGQGRLLVAWTRLVLPDGRSMTLPGLALKDRQGQTGAVGNVDNHTGRVFGSALLLSAISAGAQLSQPRQASILAAPTAGQVAAGALGQELSNVALEILRRGMTQPPTITVQQGQPFNVFVNGDLIFDGPYEPAS